MMALRRFFKGLFRGPLYPILFALMMGYRLLHLWRTYRALEQLSGLKRMTLEEDDLAREGEEFFVLGCGASVNEYTPSQWDRIAANRSLGINYWVYHDFAPDFLMFEMMGNFEPGLETIRQREKDFNATRFIAKGNYCDLKKYQDYEMRMKMLPESIHKQTFLVKDFPLPGDTDETFAWTLRWLDRRGFFDVKKGGLWLCQKRASVMMAIVLGIKLGFKKIVLCGIDLSNTAYFYDEKDYHAKGYPMADMGQTGKVHETDATQWGTLKVSDAIFIMQREICAPRGIEITVAAQSSGLYPRIDAFDWSSRGNPQSGHDGCDETAA